MESWDIKGKFIPSIKPILADVTLKTVNVEDIFNLMLVLFPYHFTMTVCCATPTLECASSLDNLCAQKLIKHIIFADHLKFLTDRQDELLWQLAGLMKDRFLKVQEEWEKSVITWGALLASFPFNLLSFFSFIPLSIPIYYLDPLFNSLNFSLLIYHTTNDFHTSPLTPHTEHCKEML
jgi:hypothetical protein